MKVITTWVNPIFYLSIAVSLYLWQPGRAMSQSMGGKSVGCDLRGTDPNSSPQYLAELNQFTLSPAEIEAELNQLTLSPAEIEAAARKITVRVTSPQNGGSGVLIASKTPSTTPKPQGANSSTPQGKITYLVLTNRHVVGKNPASGGFQIQTSDGKKHAAEIVSNSSLDPKYDLALLQFTSNQQYDLAQIQDVSPIGEKQLICSIGFPFDSDRLRFSTGKISQLEDVPFQDGTQIGYEIDRGSQDLRQGMSGGPIMNHQGQVIGINTIGSQPILPNYIYFNGSKPPTQKVNKYRQANWGIPIYNFLTQLNADILYNYDNFPKVQRQVTPTGYMAKLNRETRQKTVRIETSGGNGSGVIIAKEGTTYYVLTAKHVVEKKINLKVITHNQESYAIQPSNINLAEGLDLAVVKFATNIDYPVAELADYNPNFGSTVFAGGYPARDRIDSLFWQWQFNPGVIFDRERGKVNAQDRLSFSDGYDLLYSSITHAGMSGGPIFDTEGRVIAIHGKAEGDTTKQLILGNSLGISIQTFTGVAATLKVNFSLLKVSENPPPDLNESDRQTLIAVRDNISPPGAGAKAEQWLQYGNQLHRIGKYSEAVLAFDKAIEQDRAYIVSGNYGKALALSEYKKYSEALQAIDIAISNIDISNQSQYYYLWKKQGVTYINIQQYDRALKSIDKSISLEQNDLSLLHVKAVILIQKKHYREALVIYNRTIAEESSYNAYINRGYVKLELENKQGAIDDYNIAIELNSNNYIAYHSRGNVKSKSGDKKGAIDDYNIAIKLIPNNANYAYLTYYNRGNVKSELGDKKGAVDDYNIAIKLAPDNPDAYYSSGNVKSELGDKQGAVDDYNIAIKLAPDNSDAYHNRGNVKSELGDKEGAVDDYNIAIKLAPDSADTYYSRGNTKSELGDEQGAISDFNIAIKLNYNYALAYNNRGISKSKLGNKAGAITDFNVSLKLNPNGVIFYINRGTAKSDLGDKQGAVADYNTAIKLAPDNADAHYNRGTIKSGLGDEQGAISDFNIAIKLNYNYAEAYYNSGVIKSNLGQKQEAIADLTKAAELFRQQGKMNLYQQAMGELQKLKE